MMLCGVVVSGDGVRRCWQRVLGKKHSGSRSHGHIAHSTVILTTYSPTNKNDTVLATTDDAVLLRSLNFERHWRLFYKRTFTTFEKVFTKKTRVAFWRGSNSGSHSWRKRKLRYEFMEKWGNDTSGLVDVGFHELVGDMTELRGQHLD